jgi:16S rRNA (cytidine1402-2'-O)-methyltransferase
VNTMPTLYLLGTPLDDESPLAPGAQAILADCHVIIGESVKLARRFAKYDPQGGKSLFFLDNCSPDEWRQIETALTACGQQRGTAALFSDAGMPVLFDPGAEVLALARRLDFQVRTCPSATSWGTAAAASGFPPPFLICDFLPRDKNERLQTMRGLLRKEAHCVIMDTPYRFRALLDEAKLVFGDTQSAFLAWDISRSGEQLIWGTLAEIARTAAARGLSKGEFVLVIEGNFSLKSGKPK